MKKVGMCSKTFLGSTQRDDLPNISHTFFPNLILFSISSEHESKFHRIKHGIKTRALFCLLLFGEFAVDIR